MPSEMREKEEEREREREAVRKEWIKRIISDWILISKLGHPNWKDFIQKTVYLRRRSILDVKKVAGVQKCLTFIFCSIVFDLHLFGGPIYAVVIAIAHQTLRYIKDGKELRSIESIIVISPHLLFLPFPLSSPLSIMKLAFFSRSYQW